MNILAHWNDGGPGPWIFLFPLIWVLAIVGGILLLRRTVWRGGGRGPFGPPSRHREGGAPDAEPPLAVLDRRFASGEIDEDEYWRRFSVLNEGARDRKDGGS